MRRFKYVRCEPLESRRLLSAASFSDPVTTSIGSTAVSLIAGAFFDGLNDVVAVQTAQGLHTFKFSSGSDLLEPGTTIANASGVTPLQIISGELNFSGQQTSYSTTPVQGFTQQTRSDLILVGETSTGTTDASGKTEPAHPVLQVELGNSDGSFTPAKSYTYPAALIYPGSWNHIAAYSHLDAITPDLSGVLMSADLYYPAEPGYYSASIDPTTIQIVGYTDGRLDDGGAIDGTIDGTLPQLPVPDYLYAAAGDINGDGTADLAVYNSMYSAVQYLSHQVSTSADQIALADINGDGCSDLIAWGGKTPDKIFIWFGTAKGILAGGQTINTSDPVTALTTGDFNGDGKIDLATNLGIFYGNGDGTFAAVTPYPAGTTFGSQIIAADLNGDGRPDLVGLSTDAASIVTVINTNSPSAQAPTQITETVKGNSLVYNTSSLVVNAKVDFNPAFGTPSGKVDIYDEVNLNGQSYTQPLVWDPKTPQRHLLGTATVDSQGNATFTASGLPVGYYNIDVRYAGDNHFAPSQLTGQVLLQVRYPTVVTFLGWGTKTTYGFIPPDDGFGTKTAFAALFSITSPDDAGTITGSLELDSADTSFDSSSVGTPTPPDTQPSPGIVYTYSSDSVPVASPTQALPLFIRYGGDSNYAPGTLGPINVAPPGSELSVANLSNPATVRVGMPIVLSATVNATNVAKTLEFGRLVAHVYASTTSQTSITGATLLGSVSHKLLLAAGQSTALKLRPVIQHPRLAAGTYYLLYQLIGPDGVSSIASVGTIQTQAPFINLAAAIPAVSLPAPLMSSSRIRGSITVFVTNNGNETFNSLVQFQPGLFAADGAVAGSLVAVNRRLIIPADRTVRVILRVSAIPALASTGDLSLQVALHPIRNPFVSAVTADFATAIPAIV